MKENIKVLIINSKGEEEIVEILPSNIEDNNGDTIYDLTNYFMNYETEIFKKCIDNTPKEYQTEDTLRLLSTVFGFDLKIKGE